MAGIIMIIKITIKITIIITITIIRYGLYVRKMLLLHEPCMSSYPQAFIAAIFATQSYLNTACTCVAVPFTADTSLKLVCTGVAVPFTATCCE